VAKFRPWVGRLLTIRCGSSRLTARVSAVRHYPTLDAYIEGEGWAAVAPHAGSDAAAAAAYYAVHRSDGTPVFTDDRIARSGGMSALVLEGVSRAS
jgi:hypothetical protein